MRGVPTSATGFARSHQPDGSDVDRSRGSTGTGSDLGPRIDGFSQSDVRVIDLDEEPGVVSVNSWILMGPSWRSTGSHNPVPRSAVRSGPAF